MFLMHGILRPPLKLVGLAGHGKDLKKKKIKLYILDLLIPNPCIKTNFLDPPLQVQLLYNTLTHWWQISIHDGRQKHVNLWNKRVNINFLQPIIIKLYFRGGGGATCNFEYDLKNSRGHQSSVSYNY